MDRDKRLTEIKKVLTTILNSARVTEELNNTLEHRSWISEEHVKLDILKS